MQMMRSDSCTKLNDDTLVVPGSCHCHCMMLFFIFLKRLPSPHPLFRKELGFKEIQSRSNVVRNEQKRPDYISMWDTRK